MYIVKIFISSTVKELKEERGALVDAIEENEGWKAIYAEGFHSDENTPRKIIRKKIESSHIYLGVFKNKYGSVPKHKNPKGLSVTGFEYEWAKKSGIKLLFFIYEDGNNREDKLKEFIRELKDFNMGHWCKEFSNKEELCELTIKNINQIIREGFIQDINNRRERKADNIFGVIENIRKNS